MCTGVANIGSYLTRHDSDHADSESRPPCMGDISDSLARHNFVDMEASSRSQGQLHKSTKFAGNLEALLLAQRTQVSMSRGALQLHPAWWVTYIQGKAGDCSALQLVTGHDLRSWDLNLTHSMARRATPGHDLLLRTVKRCDSTGI